MAKKHLGETERRATRYISVNAGAHQSGGGLAERMTNLVEILASIPGVASTCIYDARSVVRQAELSGPLTAEAADRVGRSLLKLAQMGSVHEMHIKSCFYRLDKFTVIGVPMNVSKMLLVICEPKANTTLVASTIEQHLDADDEPAENFSLDFQVIDAD